MRAGRQGNGKPWEIIGRVAAAIHRQKTEVVSELLPGEPTRRAWAEKRLEVLDALDCPEAREARGWAAEHLPAAAPSVLVHGDLLGQNLLLKPLQRRRSRSSIGSSPISATRPTTWRS
jgi:aminoglycoside phosphotransferase (APT) family kinase protein